MHISERARTIQESAIRKLDAAVGRAKGVHFHRLNIGQPDVPTPRPVMEALAREEGPTTPPRAPASPPSTSWSPRVAPRRCSSP
jgi:aspartate/methionine/tyrosine aminotransferase